MTVEAVLAAAAAAPSLPLPGPRMRDGHFHYGNVCTLAGPTKHHASFDAASLALGRLGWLVFSIGSHLGDDAAQGTTAADRRTYWRTHREKIDLSTLLYIVDLPTPDAPASAARVGDDTLAEIEYAAQNDGIRIIHMSQSWPTLAPVAAPGRTRRRQQPAPPPPIPSPAPNPSGEAA